MLPFVDMQAAALKWFRNHLASYWAKCDMLRELEVFKVALCGHNRKVTHWTIGLAEEE